MLLSVLVNLLSAGGVAETRQSLLRWTIAAFLLHLAVGVAVTLLTSTWRYLGPDAEQYHSQAVEVVKHWRGDAPFPLLPPGKEGFYYLLAVIYSLFGTEMIVGLIVNATFAAAVIPLVTDTTKRLYGQGAAKRVRVLTLLLPSFLVWPSQLLREAGILFFIAVAANCATRLARHTTPPAVAFFILSMVLLFTFRGYVGLVVGLALVVGVVIARREVAAGVGAGLSVVAILAVIVFTLGVGYSGYKATTETDLKTANNIRLDSSTSAGSGFDREADISTTRRAFSYLPVGLVRISLGPFPWELRGLRQLPALADAFSIWLIFPALIAGGRVAFRKGIRFFIAVILPGLTVAMSVSLLIGNFGTLVRSRTQVLVLVTPLIAVGLSERSARRQERRRELVPLPGDTLVTR
jgi:hypothetical protein